MDHNPVTNESSELFRVVAETASDAIISIDQDSTILFANPAAERIFGYPVSDILGQQVTLLMPEYLRHLHKSAVHAYMKTGQKHMAWTGLQLNGLHQSGAESGGFAVNFAKGFQCLRFNGGRQVFGDFFLIAEAGIFQVSQSLLNQFAHFVGVVDAAKPGRVQIVISVRRMTHLTSAASRIHTQIGHVQKPLNGAL